MLRVPATSAVAEQITRASGKRARTKASSATPSGGTATLPPMRASAAANAAQGSASGRSKRRDLGQRAPGRLVAPHPGEDLVAAAHRSAPRFLTYHWRKVDAGAAGTSRCRPQALKGL